MTTSKSKKKGLVGGTVELMKGRQLVEYRQLYYDAELRD